jgi:hypothetical protein
LTPNIVDIGAASVMLVLAYLNRASHWYWPLISAATGILIGGLISSWWL